MDNKGSMSSHSNLMLVEIIHGNSSKYTQDDVLTAEIELSTRNLNEVEIENLKNKVDYIGGINIGNSSETSPDTSSSKESKEDEKKADSVELEGSDSIMVKVMIGYLAYSSLGSILGIFKASMNAKLVSLLTLGIAIYGIWGLLNRQRQPVLFLVGLFCFSLVGALFLTFNLMFSAGLIYSLIGILMTALLGTLLYFITKPSFQRAYSLDSESITKAIGIGFVVALIIRMIGRFL